MLEHALSSLCASIVVGVGTGIATSYYVSRLFYKKALLDECSRLLRRLCPYRRSNEREADGLDETSWALQIQSEIMHSSFPAAASAVAALAAEVGATPQIDSANSQEAKARDQLKDEWKRRITVLYPVWLSSRTMTGWLRLGVVLSVLWLIIFPGLYFLGLRVLPQSFAEALWPLYSWIHGQRVEVAPNSYFTPTFPALRWDAALLGLVLPVLIPWICLFIIPRTIGWVRRGFAGEKKK